MTLHQVHKIHNIHQGHFVYKNKTWKELSIRLLEHADAKCWKDQWCSNQIYFTNFYFQRIYIFRYSSEWCPRLESDLFQCYCIDSLVLKREYLMKLANIIYTGLILRMTRGHCCVILVLGVLAKSINGSWIFGVRIV